jgi:hypothetical protein
MHYRIEELSMEQCFKLKDLGFPQDTVAAYIQMADGYIRYWYGEFPSEGDEFANITRLVACPGWSEMQDWLGVPDIHLRTVKNESKLWIANITDGPQAIGGNRDEAAYNLVLAVIAGKHV